MYRGRKTAVVVPAYNEQERIVSVIRTIPDWVDFVIVVDDASLDETAPRARGVTRPGLVVLRHPRNKGVGRAIFSGYHYARKLGADLALVMAGDGQMDPDDLPRLVDALVEGAEYVKGNRFADSTVWRVMPKDRILGNIVLSILTKVTSGYRRSFDSQCGYTALSLSVLDKLDTGRIYGGYSYCNDLLCHLHRVGAKVEDRPVRPIYDGAESGIRLRTLVHPIAGVLITGLVGRILEERAGRLGRLVARTIVERWKCGVAAAVPMQSVESSVDRQVRSVDEPLVSSPVLDWGGGLGLVGVAGMWPDRSTAENQSESSGEMVDAVPV